MRKNAQKPGLTVTMLLGWQDDSGRVHQCGQVCCVERLSSQGAHRLAKAAAGYAENGSGMWLSPWQVLVVLGDNSKLANDCFSPRRLAGSAGRERVSAQR